MTKSEQLNIVRQKICDPTISDTELLVYLDTAEQEVLLRLYPFKYEKVKVPDRYAYRVIDIAVYLYNKRGAEGQTVHSENGILREYESANIPKSLLRGIIPFTGVPK